MFYSLKQCFSSWSIVYNVSSIISTAVSTDASSTILAAVSTTTLTFDLATISAITTAMVSTVA